MIFISNALNKEANEKSGKKKENYRLLNKFSNGNLHFQFLFNESNLA